MGNSTRKTKSIYLRGHPDDLAREIALKIHNEYKLMNSNTFTDLEIVGGLGVLIVSGDIYSNKKLNHKEIILEAIRDLEMDEEFILLDNSLFYEPKHYKLNSAQSVIQEQKYNTADILLEEIKKTHEIFIESDSRFLPDGEVEMRYLYAEEKLYIESLLITYRHTVDCIPLELSSLLDIEITKLALEHSVHLDKIIFNPEVSCGKIGFSRRAGSSKLTKH